MRTDPTIDGILLRKLHAAWHHANWTYLSEALKAPGIGFCDDRAKLGAWLPEGRTILLDRELVHRAPWEQVVEVLRHEMAHQYAHEVLGARHEPPHGPAFRHACERLGVDRAVAGLEPIEAGPPHKIAERVRKLLALASSSNQHEAEAAMAKAQQLMLDHNVSLVGSRQRYTSRTIGPRRLRFQRWEQLLVGVLTKHFFVDAIWIPVFLQDRLATGKVVEIVGSPENLDMAEYVHRFLTDTALRLYGAWASSRPVKSRTDKGAYLNGVVLGFRARLDRERGHREQAGLVWVGDPGLDEFYARRHPKIRRSGRGPIRGGHAYAAGHSAGRDIVLHRPLSEGPSGPTRLLTGE